MAGSAEAGSAVAGSAVAGSAVTRARGKTLEPGGCVARSLVAKRLMGFAAGLWCLRYQKSFACTRTRKERTPL